MGLIIWSGLALGRLYSPEVTIQKDHHLVTDGPYRLIRHPRYVGGIIQGIGLSLLFRSWIGLVLTCLFVAIILFRIKDEEALMSKEFGQEWETYCQKVVAADSAYMVSVAWRTRRRSNMELMPTLRIGWLNGWLALALLVLTEGILF